MIDAKNVTIDIKDSEVTISNWKFTAGSILCLFIVAFPFIFLDFYVGYTDTSCVNQEVSGMLITLKTWLLVWAYMSTVIFITTSGMFLLNVKRYKLFKMITNSFGLSWNIVGAVQFWDYMDISACDSLTRNYMYARLIISFVFTGLSIFIPSNDEK